MYETPKLHTQMGGYETIRHKVDESDCGVVNVKHHRLIAVAEHGFDAVVDNHVHHKNGFTWDNRLSNLGVLTPHEHMMHHWENGDIPAPSPPDTRKLTWLEELRAYEMYHNGECSQQTVADQFDVTQRTISSVVNKTGLSLLAKAESTTKQTSN